MECRTVQEVLAEHYDGMREDARGREIAAHVKKCRACQLLEKGLVESWQALEAWEDSEPPERVRKRILLGISLQRKIMFWLKLALPVAAAVLIAVGAMVRLVDMKTETPQNLALHGQGLQSADLSNPDEEELIAELHILKDEEFLDNLDDLVKIDYLPLTVDGDSPPSGKQKSSLENIWT